MGVMLSGVVLIFLSIGVSKWMAEGCSCIPLHPQRLFCSSQMVMRAVITGEKMNCDYDLETIKYPIKVIKVFKGVDGTKEIQYVYTRSSSSMCGITLNRGQYLLSGEINPDGFFITMCDFIQPWDQLSQKLKKNIKHRYKKGCDCTISWCFRHPCKSDTECIVTDHRVLWPRESNDMIHETVCIKNSSGSCSWYTGRSNSSYSMTPT